MTILLLDLDGTLLTNTLEGFLPVYLKGLSGRMASVADPPMLVKILLEATNGMEQNTDPGLTLEEKFDSIFFPGLGLQRADVQPLIDTFYRDDFPGLAWLTQPIPAAPRLVEQALLRGDQVVIATNPLFPRTATVQRLGWAGIPPDMMPRIHIPSYETVHFSKPNPAYLAELLGQLGWQEGSVVMVGNDPKLDIEPARKLGISVFWIADPSADWPGSGSEPPRGSLEDLFPWLDCQSHSVMQPDFSSRSALVAILRSTPAVLATLLAGRSDIELTRRPQPGEWSAVEVMCHLRDVETEVNLVRLHKVMESENPFIAGEDTDRWSNEREYIKQDCREALVTFLQARKQLLTIVDSLSHSDWKRPFRHAIFGPTLLRELINIIASHDRLHIHQMQQALNAALFDS